MIKAFVCNVSETLIIWIKTSKEMLLRIYVLEIGGCAIINFNEKICFLSYIELKSIIIKVREFETNGVVAK